jgi:hypothetical protein
MKNHGFKLGLEADKQNPEKFLLGNGAVFARGYIGVRTCDDDAFYENIISKELLTASVNYFMPMAYPDFNLAGIIYLTRIRTNFFYDFTRGTDNYVFISDINSLGKREVKMENHNYTETFRSFGLQLMTDFYVFRIPFMISSGIEASWRTPSDYPYVKLLLNFDIFGMNIGKKRLNNRGDV